MKLNKGLSFRTLNEKRGKAPALTLPAPYVSPAEPRNEAPAAEAAAPAAQAVLPFDPWRLLGALLLRLPLVALAGVLCAAIGFGLGLLHFQNLYPGTTSLIRQELPNSFQAGETGESFKPKPLSVGTLISILHSPALLKQVSEQSHPSISPSVLAAKLVVTPEKNTDVIRVEYQGWISRQATADLLAVYGNAVVSLIRDLQTQDATKVNQILTEQLTSIDKELSGMSRDILRYSRDSKIVSADKQTDAYLRQVGDLTLKYESMRIDFETIDLKLASLEKELARHNPLAAKLHDARVELDGMLVRYTEANPAIAEQRGKVEAIEKEMAEALAHPLDTAQLAEGTAGTSLYLEIVELKAQKETLSHQLEKLARVRDDLQEKLSALPEKSVQLEQMKARQQSLETARTILGSRQREAQMYVENAPGYYRVFSTPTVDDVSTKSRWPKIALLAVALGMMGTFGAIALVLIRELLDERIKTARDLSRVTKLPVVLQVPPLDGVAADEVRQWSFRSWTSLEPSLRTNPGGAVVLGVTASGPGAGCSTLLYRLASAAAWRGHNVLVVANRPPSAGDLPQETPCRPLQELLADPRAVFAGAESVGGTVRLFTAEDQTPWAAKLRHQWIAALAAWRSVRSLVVLVELPYSVDPDVILLAEAMPNLLWVSSELSPSSELRQHLETIRNSRCRFVGTVFNQRRATAVSSWIGKWAALLCVSALGAIQLHAAEPAPTHPLASWQQRLTLGAGDTLNISVFGQTESTHAEVPIQPDGNINYREAHTIHAAGLTIDELRAALDAELGKFYRNAHTIITPGTLTSKRYYILGKVIDKGAFTLDRPMTILEAVARSRGLETGLFEKNTVELADLPRAFLCRQGRRMPVDFERLFQKGDLSQNLQLEPEDYLYFPSANTNEIYVMGAVGSPGTQGFTPDATVVSMVTVRGGFTSNAYLERVLVIRGSLDHPKTFVVNVRKVLKAGAADFALQPKDIIFVSDKPWARAEELVDVALRTFVQAAASGWATGNVGPLITTPILPSVR
ncbi:MAG TPA: polysaccharide biosynthesis/export family protein [Chthoniobacter sp.]|jgi:protein involved in polysaccharide export with SLBB domain/capsular polysaccharide biosynthesis protein